MPRNRRAISRRLAAELYFSAFPEHDTEDYWVYPQKSKYGITLIVHHKDDPIDRLFVRWDKIIFRDFKQVYPSGEQE